jgi:flagellar biosynthesis protein
MAENDNSNNNDNNENNARGEQVVALKYGKGYKAPKIVAKGSGYVAERILDIAQNNDILVHTDKMLAENLNKLDLGDDIPPEMFEIVAKIYSFIDKVDVIVGKVKEAKEGTKENAKEDAVNINVNVNGNGNRTKNGRKTK